MLVPKFSPVKRLREEFDYKKIYTRKFNDPPLVEIVVVDKNVNFRNVIDFPYPIITGFINHNGCSDKGRPDWWTEGDAGTGLKCTHFDGNKNK